MRDTDSTPAGAAWDAWHAAHDHFVTNTVNSAQVGLSLGTLAGAGSVMYEVGQAATGIAVKVISTIIVTAVAAVVGFFVSRWLNVRFPPHNPPTRVKRDSNP